LLKDVGASVWSIKCPSCRIGQLAEVKKKRAPVPSSLSELACDQCGAVFKRIQNRFRLVNATDKTSQFWRNYANHSLTVDQWQAIADGAPVRYDFKVGGYVPYVPSEYSEPQPTYRPPDIDEESLASNSLGTTESDHNVPQESHSDTTGPSDSGYLGDKARTADQPYGLTDAGDHFLEMDFGGWMTTYKSLKSFAEGYKLRPEQLASLPEQGLIYGRGQSANEE
jgi:hypothetical protein